jgi:hypothetical protein
VAGNGYYIADARGLHVARSVQSSRNDTNTADTEGEYVTAWLDHGKQITDGSYEYAVIVRGAEQTADLAASPSSYYRVLQQDHTAHSVSFGSERGINLFEADTELTDTRVMKASAPCSIWMSEAGDALVLSVANPDLGYYESGNAFGQFPVQAWSIPSSKLYMAVPVMPVEVTLRGEWQLSEPTDKVTITAVDTEAGTTTVCFAGSNAESLKAVLKSTTSAIRQVDNASGITLSPSIASEYIYLHEADKAAGATARIVDLSGRTAMQLTLTGTATQRIDISPLAPGHYLLEASGAVCRFIKR